MPFRSGIRHPISHFGAKCGIAFPILGQIMELQTYGTTWLETIPNRWVYSKGDVSSLHYNIITV